MSRYTPKDIETKWQDKWEADGTYVADLSSDKPKYVGFSMFNYPSGAGIHIGHAMNYTISDIKARFKRQQGFESYHPIGWDSFGMPAENYAIKAGISPQESMAQIIPGYHKQYRAMGWSNDWTKEIATHRPDFHKWTQWIFVKMYEAGMAYQGEREQWWCESCQTVLADAQVLDGKCWRHDNADDPEVGKKAVKQWFFKISEYSEEMLEATADLDWTTTVKVAQENWIGKSVGAQINFAIKGSDEKIVAFTTAADTLYGCTFMVVAPENDLVKRLTTSDNQEAVTEYVKEAMKKSDIERQGNKEKTGVLTGAFAINPVNGKEIPIYVADYVLDDYGTGAIMAVPGSDERDYEFAQKMGIEIIYVTEQQEFVSYQDIKSDSKKYKLANSAEFDGMAFAEAKPKIMDKLIDAGQGQKQTNYRMKDWSVGRQRYWGAPIPVINCDDCGPVVLDESELPLELPVLEDFKPSGDGKSALARADEWLNVDCPKCSKAAKRETDTLDTYVCSSWYQLRYLDPQNNELPFTKEIADKWTPIDFYNGADHATAHLIYARFVTRFLAKQGYLSNPEPFKQMLYNGKVTAEDGTMFSKSKGNGVDPLEIIEEGYGADALRMYLMFAGPLEQGVRYNEQGVPGTYRYLSRVWEFVQKYISEKDTLEVGAQDNEVQKALEKTINSTIKKVGKDLEDSKYNTAIAQLMTAMNEFSDHAKPGFAAVGKDVWQTSIDSLLQLLAPFAPHIAEELWQQLGHTDSIHVDNWPELDESKIVEDSVKIILQVNGKVRADIEVDLGTAEEELEKLAKSEENMIAHLEGKEIRKVIHVPNKLVNFVVG